MSPCLSTPFFNVKRQTLFPVQCLRTCEFAGQGFHQVYTGIQE